MSRLQRVSPSLVDNPRLSDWVRVRPDGHVQISSGKVELGQGIVTALAQIAAEELDVGLDQVVMVGARTGVSPDERYTSNSMSVQNSGDALRAACAATRGIYLRAAATVLGDSEERLRIERGCISSPRGGSTTYWDLADDSLLDGDVPTVTVTKDRQDYRVVGKAIPRLDIPDKVAGRPRFIHDIRLKGQTYGRVVRPPARGARLIKVAVDAVRRLPGVLSLVHDGDFLGVVAEDEYGAIKAARMLEASAEWEVFDTLPAEEGLADFLMSSPSESEVVYLATGTCNDVSPSQVSHYPVRARFSRGYLAHASLSPSCGIAVWTGTKLHVWSHSQGIYQLREELARTFRLEQADVTVEHAEGAGCYGHNGADDAAYDAVLLAQSVEGRPVQVVWSREDEMTWEPFGPAMVTEIAVDLSADGEILGWRHDVYSGGHVSRPGSLGSPALLGATHRAGAQAYGPAADPPLSAGGGAARNAVPLYDIPNVEVVRHRVEVMPLRTSAMRALGAHLNVFAIESVIDELAEEAGEDPIKYRMSLLRDQRASDVLVAAADHSGWGNPLTKNGSRGRGVGFARYKNTGAYCAVVAEVAAESAVRVLNLTVAIDVGLVVNPDGLRNQVEGGALQAVSWSVMEEVHFDRAQVSSRDWESYPILTFQDAPSVDIVVIDRPNEPSVGSGEAVAGPTAAAVGNALANALGVHVRDLPLTPKNVVAALR